MNETKSTITLIILGYAIFALFFSVRVAILLYNTYQELTSDLFTSTPPQNPILTTIFTICLCIAILGSLIALFGITGLPKSDDNTLAESTKYLIMSSACSIVGTASYILAIIGYDGGWITIIYTVSLIFNTAFNTLAYNALFDNEISSKKREVGTLYLILANKAYIASFIFVLIFFITIFLEIWEALFYIISALYLIHWVLFFVGWGKIRASFSTTAPDKQQVSVAQNNISEL